MFANLMFTNISFFVCTEIKDCESTKYEAIQYQIGQINGKFKETIEGMLCEYSSAMNKRGCKKTPLEKNRPDREV